MKYFAIILAIILIVPELRSCKGMLSIAGETCSIDAEMTTCHTTIKKHSCCQLPVTEDDDTRSSEEGPCGDSCNCYCCTVILAPLDALVFIAINESFQQQAIWQVSNYSHEFSHPIWQPPPFLI